MELYLEILSKKIADDLGQDCIQFDPKDFVEMKCYQTLVEIQKVLDDDSLDDSECFYKIERVVRIFEQLGSNGGSRHDFG
ncbi:MAG: hypothetical protein SPE35_03085 [Butyricicoccus sp.]|nr:hypothetical protein [Butyricicoccus sp.]